MKMPKFTAEVSVYRSRAAYQATGSPSSGPGDAAAVQPAARKAFYCSMKGCCLDLRDLGYPRICCNGDECGPDVFF